MDTAHKLHRVAATICLIALALIAHPGWSQTTPAFSLSTNSLTFTQSLRSGFVTVSSTGDPITFTATIAYDPVNGGNGLWLRFPAGSPAAYSTTANVTVELGNPTMPAGTYSAKVTLKASSPANVPDASFTVVLNTATTGGIISALPSAVSLAAQVGGTVSTTSTISTISSTSIAVQVTTTTVNGINWLTASLTGPSVIDNTVNTAVAITASASQLASGTYTGAVVVTPSGSASLSIDVTFAVGTGGTGSLVVSPSTVNMTYTPNSGVFPSQGIVVGTNANATSFTAYSTADWLLVNGISSTPVLTFGTPVSISIGGSAASLAAGNSYSGDVFFTDDLGNQSKVTVNLTVISTTGNLSFAPTSLSFTAVAGSNPGPQTLQVSTGSGSGWSVTSNQAWLVVSPATSAISVTNLTVNANSANFPPGTYSGLLTFNNGQVVQVTLTVTAGGTGNVTVSPSSLTFTVQSGAGNPANQNLLISSAGSSPVNFSVTLSGGSWLSTSLGSSVQGGATPLLLGIVVNTAGLGAGDYQGTVLVTPNGGNAVSVPVKLTITNPPVVSAVSTPLAFSYRLGAANPAAQSIAVSGSTSGLQFTASATSAGNWLSISPTSGTAPQNISVSVNPAGLSAGTFNGSVLVQGAAGATGSTTINVELKVTAPLPTITRLGNAGSYVEGVIAPGEIITLFGTDLGPASPLGLALDSTGKVATTLGGVQVLVNGTPAPLVYVSGTQVSAVVPYEVAQFANANVLIRYLNQTSNGIAVSIATTAPGLFTQDASGQGAAAILNQNGSYNSPSNPAARGETIVIYMTGEGQTSPAGVTGKVTTVSATPPLTPVPLLPIAVLIGGQAANYTFAGEAPGYVSGVLQLNVVVPTTVAAGQQSLKVGIGGNESQNGVTISLK